MTHEFEIFTEIRENPDHIFYKISGTLRIESLLEVAGKINKLSQQTNIIDVLADYREVEFIVNVASVFEIPEGLEEQGMPMNARSAVVYIKGTETAEVIEMYQHLARSKGHIIYLFEDESRALDWLKNNS